MVEQGDIDWANHANDFKSMIGGVYDLNETVKAVESYIDQPGDDIDWNNTMVIVTSDHGNSYMRINTAKPLQKGQLPQQNANTAVTGSYTPAFVYPNGEVTFGSGNHTNELTRVYAKGGKTSLLSSFEGLWYAGTKINRQYADLQSDDDGAGAGRPEQTGCPWRPWLGVMLPAHMEPVQRDS